MYVFPVACVPVQDLAFQADRTGDGRGVRVGRAGPREGYVQPVLHVGLQTGQVDGIVVGRSPELPFNHQPGDGAAEFGAVRRVRVAIESGGRVDPAAQGCGQGPEDGFGVGERRRFRLVQPAGVQPGGRSVLRRERPALLRSVCEVRAYVLQPLSGIGPSGEISGDRPESDLCEHWPQDDLAHGPGLRFAVQHGRFRVLVRQPERKVFEGLEASDAGPGVNVRRIVGEDNDFARSRR